MSYRTISADGVAEIEVMRSRFRCEIVRVDDEITARGVIDSIRRQHWDARHHCSAFILGENGTVQRSNDDGEPPGTGGAPILEVLRGAGVSDVVAVSTRWFGGTLLGTGRLARAYAESARLALGACSLVDRIEHELFDVAVDMSTVGRLEHELRARGANVLSVEYTDVATLALAVPAVTVAVTQEMVAELTEGAGELVHRGRRWVDEPVLA